MKVDMNKIRSLFTKVAQQNEAVDYEQFLTPSSPVPGHEFQCKGELQADLKPEFNFDNTRFFIMTVSNNSQLVVFVFCLSILLFLPLYSGNR